MEQRFNRFNMPMSPPLRREEEPHPQEHRAEWSEVPTVAFREGPKHRFGVVLVHLIGAIGRRFTSKYPHLEHDGVADQYVGAAGKIQF